MPTRSRRMAPTSAAAPARSDRACSVPPTLPAACLARAAVRAATTIAAAAAATTTTAAAAAGNGHGRATAVLRAARRRRRRRASSGSASTAASALSSSSGNSSGGGYAAAANRRGKAMNTERMQLDVDAIELGDDKRTTLMVKNIPNKYSQRMLIEAFEDSAGLFDFLYLPIDFSNRCFPEHDHQVLTSDGFRFLDEIEARVEMQRGSVVDWRGLAVATYDERTRQLVYRQPRELVINEPGAAMVELGGGMAPAVAVRLVHRRGAPSVVATRNHELFVRVDERRVSKGRRVTNCWRAASSTCACSPPRPMAWRWPTRLTATDFPFELYGFCVGVRLRR
jgi:hypothetical protein